MKRKSLVTLLIICLIGGAIAAVPVLRKERAALPAGIGALPAPMVYNTTELLALDELLQVYNKLRQMQHYTFEGMVDVSDPVDSSANLSTRMLYTRSGDSVYYQLGEVRTLSLPGIYVSVDDAVKKIFVSGANIAVASPISPFDIPKDSLLQLFALEGYAVLPAQQQEMRTMRLLRENHISCKEYRLDYDEQLLIRRIFTRLTDFNDPLNKEKDKRVNVVVNRWQEGLAMTRLLNVNSLIRPAGDGFTPAPGLEDYEIIMN